MDLNFSIFISQGFASFLISPISIHVCNPRQSTDARSSDLVNSRSTLESQVSIIFNLDTYALLQYIPRSFVQHAAKYVLLNLNAVTKVACIIYSQVPNTRGGPNKRGGLEKLFHKVKKHVENFQKPKNGHVEGGIFSEINKRACPLIKQVRVNINKTSTKRMKSMTTTNNRQQIHRNQRQRLVV